MASSAPKDEDIKNLKTALESAKLEASREADMNTAGYVRTAQHQGPGRLGDPKMNMGQDPRLNAKLKPILAQFGADKNQPPSFLQTLRADSSIDEIAETVRLSEQGAMMLYNAAPVDLPSDEYEIELERTEEVIPGGDGQDMTLFIYKPKLRGAGPLPCVVYSHGGGMTMIPTMNRVHDRWCRSLAASGLVVVMVDFRNAWSEKGYNHFPAGLNDCCAAVQWVHSQREQLNIKSLVLQGESGGGNLACATALKAKREGWVAKIDGVYGTIPYISNAYGWTDQQKLKFLPSLIECNGYFLNMHYSAFQAHFYTPTSSNQTNPLAWPYHATPSDLEGLPPHILAMDELDPLRDEGIAYARKLAEAGVSAKGHVNLGVGHGTGLFMRAVVPEYWAGAVRDVCGFARSL